MIDQLETADALRLVGVDPKAWQKAIDRGYYTEAPKAQQGKARRYVRDDVIAMAVFGTLIDLGVIGTTAARLASDTRAWMKRDEKVVTLHIINRPSKTRTSQAEIVEELEPDDVSLILLPIAKWRRDWATKIRQLIAERDAEIS